MPLCQGCLDRDGKPNCELRVCASEKGLADCSMCSEPAKCENREILEKMRSGAQKAGLLVKTANVDRNELIQRWTDELKKRWSHSILFSSSR